MGKASEKSKCWLAFAEWVKLRDCPNGIGNCISCNKVLRYPNSDGSAHAGHFYPRSVVYNNLYFHEMNVHTQCHFCNTHLEGNTLEYRKGMIRRYGEEVLEELDILKSKQMAVKLYDHDFKEMAKDYRAKSRAMKKEYGIS